MCIGFLLISSWKMRFENIHFNRRKRKRRRKSRNHKWYHEPCYFYFFFFCQRIKLLQYHLPPTIYNQKNMVEQCLMYFVFQLNDNYYFTFWFLISWISVFRLNLCASMCISKTFRFITRYMYSHHHDLVIPYAIVSPGSDEHSLHLVFFCVAIEKCRH